MNEFLFLASPVLTFALLAALQYGLEAWARRIRATPRRATKGLTPAERDIRRAALHLHDARARAIADLGTEWVLHPNYKPRARK